MVRSETSTASICLEESTMTKQCRKVESIIESPEVQRFVDKVGRLESSARATKTVALLSSEQTHGTLCELASIVTSFRLLVGTLASRGGLNVLLSMPRKQALVAGEAEAGASSKAMEA